MTTQRIFTALLLPTALLIAVLSMLACTAPAPLPTYTPYPTWTPAPTATAYPTPTTLPTWTPRPTATAYPTPTTLPTWTPAPTATAYPTPTTLPTWTPLPTYTPYPTYTRPRPTNTPRPTATPRPTNTPVAALNERYNIPSIRVLNPDEAHYVVAVKDGRPLVIVGCYVDVQATHLGEVWYSFSRDGRFEKSRKMVSIGGFSQEPIDGNCYEMAVKYEGTQSEICYYTRRLSVPPVLTWPPTCSGWKQDTREFYTVDSKSIRSISRDEWRRKYHK